MKRIIDNLIKRFAAAVAKELEISVMQIARAEIKPGDKIIFRVSDALSDPAWERIKEELEKIFPGHKALILEEGADIGFIGSADETK